MGGVVPDRRRGGDDVLRGRDSVRAVAVSVQGPCIFSCPMPPAAGWTSSPARWATWSRGTGARPLSLRTGRARAAWSRRRRWRRRRRMATPSSWSQAVTPPIRSCIPRFPTTPSRILRRSRCWPRRPISCWCAPILRSGRLADVIAQARAKPGSLSFAHAGTGTSTHLAGELLKNLAKIDINAIPYKGGAPAINDLLGGQIPMSFNNGPESVGQIEAGTVRALAVTTASRASFLPDVPSMAETVPGYDTEVWWGLLGPAGMPRDLVEKLSHDFVAALNTRGRQGAADQARRVADRQLAAAIRCQDPRRLQEMGPDHRGRRHKGRVMQWIRR